MSPSAVITAPDGGEDAKIEWTGGPERTKFLPARYTQLQLKAADLSPAEAADEVLTAKGDVKPMVRRALEAGGTYVLACGHSYTNSKIVARAAAVRKSLTDAGLAKLPPEHVSPLFDQLLSMTGYAYSVALDLIGMYVHGAGHRLESLRPQLIAVAKNVRKRPKRPGSQMDAHHFEQIINWLLKKGREDVDARTVAIELANHAVANADDVDGLVKPVLPILLTNFAPVIWPVLGRAIVADQGKAWRLQHLLGDSYSFADKKNPAILNVPEDILFAWCHANPDVGPAFLAQFVPILESQRAQPGGNKLHPITKRLLDEFGDRDDVLKRLVGNMYTFGWSGSRTTYYALYEEPLRSLENHPIGAVRRWAKTMLGHMLAEIQAAKTEDDEQQAEWTV